MSLCHLCVLLLELLGRGWFINDIAVSPATEITAEVRLVVHLLLRLLQLFLLVII